MNPRIYFICALFRIFYYCYGFNLETRLPVIKRGNEGAYFGFSVAEHQSFDEVKGQIRLLVGAPLDQNKQPKTNRSGALWRCPITTLQDDCDQIYLYERMHIYRFFSVYVDIDDDNLMPPLDDEVKDGQWLGVTVRSQGTGGKVMVCAHRYIRSGEDFRFAGGLCYTLSQRLDYDDTWEPCKGRPVNRAHEQFGYCQAGTSGLLVNDTALIGTPGPFTWRGTVFAFSVSDDFLRRDKTMYYSPLSDDPKQPLDKYSYLGMSVTAGEYFGPYMSFAAGAPRSNGTGQVFIFTKVRPSVTVMKISVVLSGEQFTSNFGYETTTADLNGDRLPDLLVGAPNYFSKDSGGAVYIYINHKYCLNCHPPIKITGQQESRFGIAIANLGDLNKDSYEDIAIGAPYEGYGAVYIYLGSKDGIVKEPSQVIRGEHFKIKTFGYSLSGGLDLDNNGYPDLLTGAFEASSVVLFRARPIVGLTTRVGPKNALSNIDPNSKGCDSHPNSNHTCFKFEACVSMQAVVRRLVVSQSGSIRLKYKLEADIHKKIPRVWFDHEHHVKPHNIEHEIGLQLDSVTGELKHCHYHTVFVKDGTKDIQSAISMRLNYWLVQAEPIPPQEGEPLPSVDDFPILNQQQAAKVFDATFLKDCGDNDICESELVVEAFLDLPQKGGEKTLWELVLGEHQEVVLNATIYNLHESAYEAQLQVKHSPSLSYIGQIKQKTHTCQPINAGLVVCSIGNPLERQSSANVILRFDPKGLTDIETKIEFILSPNTTSTPVEAMTPSILRASVIKRAELSLKGLARPEQVFYGGEVKGESAMVYKDDIGSRILHTYQIVNQGPWRVGPLELHIEWPFQVANNKPLGKWLLYMDDRPYVEAISGGECFMLPGQVNPLGLQNRPGFFDSPLESKPTPAPPLNSTTNSPITTRRKRDLEMVVRPEQIVDGDGHRHDVVYMVTDL
ncbi:hypothetical protein AAG570_009542 [Ranatra chinensis]|uniref:Uncharacterized protein n=1 Tax=Ranatra chinensis TaxID=642074 RepID=A0ABD0YPF2_9HEMI